MNALWITLVSPNNYFPPNATCLAKYLFEIMWMPTMMAHEADTYKGCHTNLGHKMMGRLS